MDISDECKRYFRERQYWQQIIVVDGVTVIPEYTFCGCKNIKRVIFANTVIRIKSWAFSLCTSLVFIKWSIRLEYIGKDAFQYCNLSSIFMPPTCREICQGAFQCNRNLSVFHVPQETDVGRDIILGTAIAGAIVEASPMERNNQLNVIDFLQGRHDANDNMNQLLKNINNGEQYALHRACAGFWPLKEVIHAIIL
ncbi:hypothetical protein CTEN210_00259 [Chaetoceros tenuissimus]|uniref:Uncharacterized protein n=1 Tax=Chaetoceros tenuissimus TaxID=426638 RepID=A0AAD3GYI8_9STRA|nr:hypothetical protein CTEN210_00259 [Chaetoceros tenuissimus]